MLFQYQLSLPRNATERDGTLKTTQEVLDWSANVQKWNYMTNTYAILDTVARNLLYSWQLYFETPLLRRGFTGTFHLPDGSEVETADILSKSGEASKNDYTILEITVLNTERYNESVRHIRMQEFDPRRALNLSEDFINELLANVSISALSLRTWYGNVTVNSTEFRSVYRFQYPLNLILPYSMCLAATLVFVVLGINALRENGVPATDGGFLQILMTTTGDTVLNKVASRGALASTDAAPKELLNMKVRFGNLSEGSTRGAGFGTIEETTPLERKGWRMKKLETT